MEPSLSLLLPRPKEAALVAGTTTIQGPFGISVDAQGEVAHTASQRLLTALRSRRVDASLSSPEEAQLRLRLQATGHPQGYRLEVRPEPRPGEATIEILADAPAGLLYGAATLEQWLRLHPLEGEGLRLRGLRVRDWPDFPVRGLLLDISRNRVPTLETALHLVETLAGWKLNQLQLYMEHTFAYRGHETVWRGASPWTAEELRTLDAHCRAHTVELVPNQNSFGHFHRWLVHAPYRPLAECPEGIEHPFSPQPEPFSLCPTDPRCLALLADLYDQLLGNFSSRLFNVGLDETLDLGLGRSAAACAKYGKERVYLDFLQKVHGLARGHGRRIQLWGDIILKSPELIDQLPEDVIALEWGYEADHPFAEDCQHFAAAGRELYVCPGTSSWNTFAGRGENAERNLASAARHGHANGASGYLITDWGDNGHLQPLAVSLPGILSGAACAWNTATAEHCLDRDNLPMHTLLDLHAFTGSPPGTGRAALDLAATYLLTGAQPKNGSVLFHLLISHRQGLEHPRYQGMTRQHLSAALDHIAQARAGLTGDDLASRELAWAAEALSLGARLGLARLAAAPLAPLAELPERQRRELAANLRALTEGLTGLWLARCRPGGLRASKAKLESLAEELGF